MMICFGSFFAICLTSSLPIEPPPPVTRQTFPIEKEIQTADWDMEAAEKGGYPHFMIKEINEQPEANRTTIMPRIKEGLPFLEECGITKETIKDFKNITIVACGTAMHAGMVGKFVIEDLARVSVYVDIASEFRYRNPIVFIVEELSNNLCICVA